MPSIYLDESGDMGFDFTKPKTTKFFVVTCLFVVNKRPAEKIVKGIIKKMPLKERLRHTGVLHAHKETDKSIRRLLTGMAAQTDNISIIALHLDKTKVHTNWHDQKHALYNQLANILLDRIYGQHLVQGTHVEVIASRRETKSILNQGFKEHLEKQIMNNHKVKINVEIEVPARVKGLQLADFASWAIFRDREHQDNTYKQIIKGLIVEEGIFQ